MIFRKFYMFVMYIITLMVGLSNILVKFIYDNNNTHYQQYSPNNLKVLPVILFFDRGPG